MLALDSRSLIQPNSGLARLSFLPVYRRLPSCCGTAETPGTNFSLFFFPQKRYFPIAAIKCGYAFSFHPLPLHFL